MPLLPRSQGGGASSSSAPTISKAYGTLVLIALLVLILFRHAFGSIRVEARA